MIVEMKPKLISAVRLHGFEASRPRRQVIFSDNLYFYTLLRKRVRERKREREREVGIKEWNHLTIKYSLQILKKKFWAWAESKKNFPRSLGHIWWSRPDKLFINFGMAGMQFLCNGIVIIHGNLPRVILMFTLNYASFLIPI